MTHTFSLSGSLNSTCSSPTSQLGFLTDRSQQYLPTMQQIPSSPLYELWVNMSGITSFVPLCQAAGWKTNSRLFAKQLIIKKWCTRTAAHKDSSWFEFSQVEDAEWDRCQWLSARRNLLPNNVWTQCYGKHLPGDPETKMTNHAQYKSQ